MKVLFLKDCQSGKKGQIKDITAGFAQNFLIPKGFVVVATPQIQAKFEKENKEAEIKKLKEAEKLTELKADLERREFSIKVKVGEKGQIFGGIHEKDVANVIAEKMGIQVDKSQVQISAIIKEIGMHFVNLKLGNGIIAKAKIIINAE